MLGTGTTFIHGQAFIVAVRTVKREFKSLARGGHLNITRLSQWQFEPLSESFKNLWQENDFIYGQTFTVVFQTFKREFKSLSRERP